MAEEKKPVSDDRLESVAGGANADGAPAESTPSCPQCGSTNVMHIEFPDEIWWHCYDCGYEWGFQ